MFNLKKKNKLQSTLKPMNIIGIKSNREYRLPMVIFTSLITIITMYCIVRIELDSFKLLGDSPAGPYVIDFTASEIRHFYFILMLGCIVICIVNGLKKHLLKSTILTISAYIIYFGWHYKYVANGFVHMLNKAIYTVLAQSGQKSDIYYLTYFEMTDIKLELEYFIMAVIFGTCFLLAYSAVNRCNPVFFTICVSVYVAVPFICNTFVGESFLVCAGIICILMFIIHFQGYSNFTSKKIFAGFGNSIKIRGRYVSFSAFQQAVVFLIFTFLVLGISNIFCDFKDYHRSEKVDNFGRNLIYSVQNITSTNNFGTFGNTSNGLNNGDLANMGDLHYTGEIMFEVKANPSHSVAPLYFRAFTAAEYSDEKWTALSKNCYKSYDFWDTLFSDNFYPQFCSGDAAKASNDNLNYVNISINSKNINPKIFLNEYRTVSGETDVLNDVSAEYDNEFSFNAFGGIKNYEQSAVIRSGISKNNIAADTGSLDGDFYNLLHDGDFEYFSDSTVLRFGTYNDAQYSDEYNKFKKDEKLYRSFVVENYLDYPDGMESYLPENFDSRIQDLYDSYCYDQTFISYFNDNEENIFYSMNDYNDEFGESSDGYSYNRMIVPEYYSEVILYIKDYLQSNAEYTLTPGATPKDRELVEYFLTENHKGYCVHFATAATLMLRRAGIPARYVEGYFVSDYDFNKKNSQGYSGIPDSNAHAWTEVYYPLIGWQVVDFTPYYSEEMLPEENKTNKDSDTKTDTKTETDTESDTETETDTETESDTDTESDEEIDSNTEQRVLNSSDSDREIVTPQAESSMKKFFKAILNVVLKILKIVLILVLIVVLWLLTRFIVLKIRYIRFNSTNTRKGARAMYLHSLWLLRISGVTPKKGEGDREFAGRAVLKIEGIKTKEYECFTDFALNARFGKDSPSEQDILQMNDFLKNLSECIYNSSSKRKKLLMKYILFLN